MKEFEKSKLIASGRQNCSDMHSLGPGFRTAYIIHYIIRGSGYYVCEGKKYHITAGQSFLIRPFTEISYYPDSNDPWEYTWIDFTGDNFTRLITEKTEFCDGNCVIDYIEPEAILPLFDCLCSICAPNSIFRFSEAPESIALSILKIYSELHPLLSHKTKDSFYFDSACAIIQSSYHKQELNIDYICKELNISRATLHRSFTSNCKIPTGAYIINYRMERAKELLSHGITVKATALSCGFSDPLYFSKVFRKTYGISPGEFAKLQ